MVLAIVSALAADEDDLVPSWIRIRRPGLQDVDAIRAHEDRTVGVVVRPGSGGSPGCGGIAAGLGG